MKNEKPEASLVNTWLEQEYPNDETSGESVQGVDPSAPGSKPDSSGEDEQSIS